MTDRHEAGRHGSMKRKDFWRNGLAMNQIPVAEGVGGRQAGNGRNAGPGTGGRDEAGDRAGYVFLWVSRVALISVAAPVSRPLQNGLFNGLIWPKTGFASTDLPQRPRQTFFP
ncbi:hypothetical protein [Brucella pseudogrignonensis]|uniref:Uncharacterized protein n=1 Tax=Brucella pseudogrignonensis TaxID=419475 RepID=A0A256GHE6_9HYPH|nr:hypothetical protein [Brucella pseudogrignonensis]OYR26574.1 hypothetical protein CEV34_2235 [Brucella pseudogrignonensis]